MPYRRQRTGPHQIPRLRQRLGLPALAAAAAALAMSCVPPPASAGAASAAQGPLVPGTHCPAFPADAVWNTPVTGLPVDSHSAQWLTAMGSSSTYLHPDYGPSGDPKTPYGIAWNIAPRSAPLTKIKFLYASQSDKGPYPFTASTPIEGGQSAGGDRHALMVSTRGCVLYELYDAYYHPHGHSTAGSGALWNLASNHLRPASWTSADAAGLPIMPLLVNYDEVKSGAMNHAIRMTSACTTQGYLWPARHWADEGNHGCPPMGARFRLDAGFRLPAGKCAAFCQTVLTTMKTYGLIVADDGTSWYFQGTMDTRWTYQQVDQLKQIPASEFQAVNESCLQVSPNSARAYQPGTSSYQAHCG